MNLHKRKVFVTGGAGFIGSKLVHAIAHESTNSVVVYDSLLPQVHGKDACFPDFPANVICVLGDVCDTTALTTALVDFDPDVIAHFAAETGTGQSLEELQRYCCVNVVGTANLLAAVAQLPQRRRDFLLPSSRSIYGEGPYSTASGQIVYPPARSVERMMTGDFKVYGLDGSALKPLGANALTIARPLSVYASTKLMQEHLLQNTAEAKMLVPKILRFQNVYGPGQSLRNPYTGVLSIFASQILKGEVLNIFEDGGMIRDFVFVDDVVNACRSALCTVGSVGPLDVGSGEPTTILHAARILLDQLGGPLDGFRISGDFRVGDISSAYADIEPIRSALGWRPSVSLEQGLSQLASWAKCNL